MNDFIYRIYCLIHFFVKKILGRNKLTAGNLFSFLSIKKSRDLTDYYDLWLNFINKSKIKNETKFEGSLYAGYIAETHEWCLPSWVWTCAATIRMFCKIGKLDEAKTIASYLIERQQDCGGWIVRYDYDKKGAIPMLAPNDSAYIANNAFIELYLRTKDNKYLEIAKNCADWIIETARPDGLVYTGYNIRDMLWEKDCIIVDTGFTAGLFARLYEITKEEKYKRFLNSFINKYIELFYSPTLKGFATSINKYDKQQGGMFGRGQAWALEGLVPAYCVTKEKKIKAVIEDTIENLLEKQCKNGAWAYNLTKPLMGEDCKAVSVIAKDMLDWYTISSDARIKNAAKRALKWCIANTAIDGEAKGGIFSFCMEGAVVQNLYTSCAFVYASAYAIELDQMLKQ